jgi:indole-3-glycerol phosphate synthase
MRPAVLSEIAEFTRKRVAEQKRVLPPGKLLEQARNARQPRPFAEAFGKPGTHVIAEIKRASPSEGQIAPGADPVAVAQEYLSAGATALSVLTEPGFFKGDVEFLARIRAVAPEALLLMKDFVLEEYQLAQARFFGADAVLLIVAMLEPADLKRLFGQARALGLEALVEVHDDEELKAAAELGATLVGVNNRNLKTMKVSLETSERLAPLAPKGATLIAESGLSSRADLDRLAARGFHGFLIGTAFMKSGEPGRALGRLLAPTGGGGR